MFGPFIAIPSQYNKCFNSPHKHRHTHTHTHTDTQTHTLTQKHIQT